MSRRFPASHDEQLQAFFYAPGTKEEILRRLMYAKVQAIGSASILFVGKVIIAERPNNKAKTNAFEVGYLCKLPGTPVVVSTQQIAASKAKRAMRDPSGFDPRDDDMDAYPKEPATTYGPLDPSVST